MKEHKNVRIGRGIKVHSTSVDCYRKTLCGLSCDGAKLADEATNCKPCLRVMLDALN